MNEPADPSIALRDAYRDAVLAKDVDAFVALYDRDVRVFDLWGAWSCDGIDAWRAMAADWFASLGDERVVVTFRETRSQVTPALTIFHAFVEYRALALDGTTLHAMTNRLTWSLAPTTAGWKIVHEHTSAPIDPQSAKAILGR